MHEKMNKKAGSTVVFNNKMPMVANLADYRQSF